MTGNANVDQLEAEFREWGRMISELEAAADRAITRAKGGVVGVYARLAECEDKQRLLRRRLDVVARLKSGGVPRDLAAAVIEASREVRDACARARVALH